MVSNRKYAITTCALLGVIVAQVIIPLQVGGKIVVDKNEYENIRKISNKYIKQENVLKDLKEMFLFDVKDDKMQEGSLKGMVDSLDDPYTVYMDKDEYRDLKDLLNESYIGVGVVLAIDKENNIANIGAILPNSPAQEVGLEVGDVITKINGEEILASTIENISSKIKGKENTTVTLEIQREGEKKTIDIKRRKVEMVKIYSDKIGNIGYIKLLEFDENAGKQFKDKLNCLMEEGIEKLIIDLRGNPGGLLNEVVEIANMFVTEGNTIVYTEDKEGKSEEHIADGKTEKIKIPLAVLVDENSASASELFSGVIKDNKLGVIVGSRTYGKGVVQIVKPYTDGSALKVTISEYFTPSGNRINKNGVQPDIELNKDRDYIWNYSDPEYNIEKDKCLQAALKVL